eukprot:Hpha_TRINITY_DN2151_c0_g1::TRINITY_DN2151_c0_g1_i1::g.42256::m.42256
MRAGAVLLLCTLGAEGAMQTFQLTWYGAKDNCPPGGDIAYPGSAPRHAHAGGTGTYADPITFAGARKREAPGTIYYIPTFQKYFVMEDDCEECGEDWSKGKYHIDLWMGSTTVHPGKGLIECEDSMTARHPVNTAPPANLTVNTTAIFDATRSANQGCLYPVESCTDVRVALVSIGGLSTAVTRSNCGALHRGPMTVRSPTRPNACCAIPVSSSSTHKQTGTKALLECFGRGPGVVSGWFIPVPLEEMGLLAMSRQAPTSWREVFARLPP